MQIKTTVTHHLTLVRVVIIKKSTNKKCWRGCGKKRTILHSWWKYKLVPATVENNMEVLQNLKIDLIYDPATPILGISRKNYSSKRYTHPYDYSSTIYSSQDTETTYISISRWMDKKDVVHPPTHSHTHTQEYYSAMKKNKTISFVATQIDLEIILSEVRQIRTNIIPQHLYVESKIWHNWTHIYATETNSQT